MRGIWEDIRYSARSLARSPGFSACAVLTLALGIGANTAIFSVVHGVLLEKLPYEDEERLVTLHQTNVARGIAREELSPANFLDLREQSRSFAAIAAADPYSHSYFAEGEPELFQSWLVTRGFFEIFGVPAFVGRTFIEEEYEPGSDDVVVLSHALWQRRFGSDPGIVGRALPLRGRTFTVVGVMPPEFQYPAYDNQPRDLWAPSSEPGYYRNQRQGGWLPVVARLQPGVSIEQARAEANAIGQRLAEEFPNANAGKTFEVIPLREELAGTVRPALLTFLGAVALVLLIACANVANLVLVRGRGRLGEIAVRSALGARRGRVLRLFAVEHLLLALCGGLGGVILAHFGLQALLALAPDTTPLFARVQIDASALAFAFGVSCFAAVAFGVGPALTFSARSPSRSLAPVSRRIGPSRQARRSSDALVVVQVALALTLLSSVGLLSRSFWNLMQVDPGFRTDGILSLQVNVYSSISGDRARADFFRTAVERLGAEPGLADAAAVSNLPFHTSPVDFRSPISIQGRPVPQGQSEEVFHTVVTGGYFRLMGIPLVSGRTFQRSDATDGPRVAVINREMADRYWPGEDPVGSRVSIGYPGSGVAEVIGVVGNVKPRSLESDPQPEIYLPHAQTPVALMTFVARTSGDPAILADSAKAALREVEPRLLFTQVATLDDFFDESLRERRFSLTVLGVFAMTALALACVGLYGLVSYRVASRQAEIGVRMAMGARAGDVVGMVIREHGRVIFAGVALGLGLAAVSMRLLDSMLFELDPLDPLSLAAAAAVMIVVGLAAAFLPARRAARIEPVEALRHE